VPPGELVVVGDADQSIYAFRGATIPNILEFERDYPDATTVLLEQNYRSTQTILSAANAVITRNEGRKAKNLWSDAGDGERIDAATVVWAAGIRAAPLTQQIPAERDNFGRLFVDRDLRGFQQNFSASADARCTADPLRCAPAE